MRDRVAEGAGPYILPNLVSQEKTADARIMSVTRVQRHPDSRRDVSKRRSSDEREGSVRAAQRGVMRTSRCVVARVALCARPNGGPELVAGRGS